MTRLWLLLVIAVFAVAFAPPPQTTPTVRLSSSANSIDESELLQRTARVPVTWATTNRPNGSTLVFEQVLADGPVNIELPRANPWVNSNGDGLVTPWLPYAGSAVQLQVRLIRLSDGATLARAELSLPVVRSGVWHASDALTCIRAPYPASLGLETGIYGLVRQDRSVNTLAVYDVPAPVQQNLGHLAAGEKFVVTDGPYCYPYPWPSDGTPYLRWWQVQSTSQALTGWVEEYGIGIPDGLHYTIEPYPYAGSYLRYFDAAYCDTAQGFAPSLGLRIGATAHVTPTIPPHGLPLAETPLWYFGRDQGDYYLQWGETVTVVDGPICFSTQWYSSAQSHFRLWRVRSEVKGVAGWTAEYGEYRLRGWHNDYLALGANAGPAVSVVQFSATPDPVARGGTLTLRWQVNGTSRVSITRFSETGGIHIEDIGNGWLSPQGSLTYTIPERYVEQIPFALYTDAGLAQVLTLGIICPIAAPLTQDCPLTQNQIGAAFQPFENGYMVWRSDTRTIYVLHKDGRFEEYPDTWVEGRSNPVTDTPPAGYVKPERGFGEVWGSRPYIRESLGWGLATEVAYTMTLEVQPGVWNRPDRLTFTLPDGRLVQGVLYSGWSFVTP